MHWMTRGSSVAAMLVLLAACAGSTPSSSSGDSSGSGATTGSSSGSSDGSGSTTSATDDTATPTISAALKLATETSGSASLSPGLGKSVGQVTSAGLTSLKYYIKSITICNTMTTSGTAYNNPEGCLDLYTGNQSDSRYTYELGDDYAPFGDVARGSDDGFVDLMDDTSRATLNSSTTLTASDVRSYNYGYITWYLPVKLTATIDMGSGVTYRTQDGATTTVDVNQGPITTATGNFASATTAAEAVVVLGNGGSWFRFQNPFVISQSDIDDGTQFALDLTFNPDGLVKGYSSGLGGCGGCILQDSAGNQLLVPMIGLTPVPHRTTEHVAKETYLATVSSGADNFDIRLELYSIEGDTAATIYGVDSATLVNASTTTAVSPFPKISFLETADDGTLTLEDYRGSTGPVITGFARQSTAGETFTATLQCGDPSSGGFQVDGCSDGGTLDLHFTLDSVTRLE